MSMMVSFVLSFFPRDVLDEILNLIESVSEDFPSYSFRTRWVPKAIYGRRKDDTSRSIAWVSKKGSKRQTFPGPSNNDRRNMATLL